jgi:hypothetical protein
MAMREKMESTLTRCYRNGSQPALDGKPFRRDVIRVVHERWTPRFRPLTKLYLPGSAQNEKEQTDETKTQTICQGAVKTSHQWANQNQPL